MSRLLVLLGVVAVLTGGAVDVRAQPAAAQHYRQQLAQQQYQAALVQQRLLLEQRQLALAGPASAPG